MNYVVSLNNATFDELELFRGLLYNSGIAVKEISFQLNNNQSLGWQCSVENEYQKQLLITVFKKMNLNDYFYIELGDLYYKTLQHVGKLNQIEQKDLVNNKSFIYNITDNQFFSIT